MPDLSDGRLDLDAGRLLFARDCTFLGGARRLEDLPSPGLPEVAFAGRSNVGKSSLLNALTGRTTLARVSHTPGRTREINLFVVGGRLVLADLPGYGYARAARREAAGWRRGVADYFGARATLRRVFLLIDSRRGVMAADENLMQRLDAAGQSFQVVLTKSDRLKPDSLQRVVDDVARGLASHPAAYPAVLAGSSRSGAGMTELRAALAALAAPQGSSIRRAGPKGS